MSKSVTRRSKLSFDLDQAHPCNCTESIREVILILLQCLSLPNHDGSKASP